MKIKTFKQILRYPRFAWIKYKTKGYLSPEVYHEYFRSGYRAPEGHAVDIGPAQGGTTMSLGLGYQKSNKPRQFKIYSIEKGVSSRALAQQAVDQNYKILLENISSLDLQDRVEIIMNTSEEAFEGRSIPSPLSVLSIDADGALDRDFKIFYNSLISNSQIILDDYEDIIDSHGKEKLAMPKDELQKYLKQNNITTLAEINPLGKKYSIFKFVNYLIEQNMIKKDRVIGNTFFGSKPENAPVFSEEHFQDLQNIRSDIEKEFWSLRS